MHQEDMSKHTTNTRIYFHRFICGKKITVKGQPGEYVVGGYWSDLSITPADEVEHYLLSESEYPTSSKWDEIDRIQGVKRDDWERRQIAEREGIPVESFIKNGGGWSCHS